MRKASELLSEERFWQLIDSTAKSEQTLSEQHQLLKNELMKLTQEELVGYHYQFCNMLNQSYLSRMWAVAYTVMGGCSDDGFDYFRMWLITRGKNVFDTAVQNPDSLCDEFDKIADGDIPEFEDASYIPNEVMKEKFSLDLYEEEDKYEWKLKQPEMEFDWEEEDEDSIRKVCPKTFKKWWDNDTF